MPAQHVPTVRYHPTEPPRVVETAQDLAALGEEWHDHPWSAEEAAQWQSPQEVETGEHATTPPVRKR